MKTRKLIPSTIIPPELYVQREADRQLRRIINDAARPACVLVARQMGKTNLLLNAKRELEDSDNAFVYVDLSIPFTSDRECFRHIIDIALDAGCVAFANCKSKILSGRDNTTMPAFKEHELELRALLGTISGKLVIFLDEIDSLARGNFSDRVFAQIRSVYFSRVNYPLFNRLTYVLSGVLEPNEIIKDKRISPFNIAEKIYLDDFSPEEYGDFLHRSGLHFDEPVKERIFEWAAGNPRITWDVCADLEDKVCRGVVITTDEVDQTVAKIYLKDFNQAPVDHIREVVSNDDELRNAVTVIKFNKGETLPDAIKNKLYLAGIISAAQNYKNVKIKNRVLESALSDQWLHDVEVNKKGIAKLAEEKFEGKDYRAALELYEQFFKNAELPEDKYKLYSIYYNAGTSAYHISESEKAIKYLELSKWEKDVSPALYFEIKLMLGGAYLAMGKVEVSRGYFQEIIEHPKRDSKYLSALINLGSSYLFEEEFQTAIQIYQRAIADVNATALDKTEVSRLTAVIYVSLGNSHLGTKDDKRAKECFDKALEFCLPDQKPAIVIGLLKCQMTQAKRRDLVTDCVKHILDNQLRPSAPDPEKALALTHSNLMAILTAVFEYDRPSFNLLLDFAARSQARADESDRLLPQLAIYSLRQRKTQIAGELAKAALTKQPLLENSLSDLDELEMVRLLCLVTTGNKQRPHVKHFVELLRKGIKPTYFRYTDVGVLSDEITTLSDSGHTKEVEEIFALAKSHLHKMDQDEIGTFALLHFNYLVSLVENGPRSRIKQAAEDCLAFINSLPHSNGSEVLIGDTGLARIREFAEKQLKPAIPPPEPIVLPRKFERNEKISVKYPDGTIVSFVKFKKVESDLLSGRCVVLEVDIPK